MERPFKSAAEWWHCCHDDDDDDNGNDDKCNGNINTNLGTDWRTYVEKYKLKLTRQTAIVMNGRHIFRAWSVLQ